MAGNVHIHELIALKPICENLGLNWSGAHQKINRDPKLSQLCVPARMISEDGKNREMLCMKPSDFQDWLYNLTPTENVNLELLAEYKKGLVMYLLMMLKISLDEINRLHHIEREHGILKSMVTNYINSNEQGKDYTKLAKGKFKESAELQKEILERMKNTNPDQLKLL